MLQRVVEDRSVQVVMDFELAGQSHRPALCVVVFSWEPLQIVRSHGSIGLGMR
jgi:hypothetical protein